MNLLLHTKFNSYKILPSTERFLGKPEIKTNYSRFMFIAMNTKLFLISLLTFSVMLKGDSLYKFYALCTFMRNEVIKM